VNVVFVLFSMALRNNAPLIVSSRAMYINKNKMRNKKICCIFNYAPHYRYSVYQKMAETFDVNYYFGDKLIESGQIKKIEYSQLKGFKGEFTIKIYSHFVIWKGLLNLLLKHYDIYVLTGRTKVINQWVFLFLCKIFNKKTYNWWHGFAPGHQLKGFRRIKEKFFFSLFSGHLIYGDKARLYMEEIGFLPEKMNTIYNSLDYDKSLIFRKAPLENPIYHEHFKNSAPTLIFIGRLTKVKKLEMLIEAYYQLEKQGMLLNLVFVGDGPEKDTLEKMADGDKRIWFHGALYDEDKIAQLLYNADLCVSPGNVGLTAIHAIYYGLPVITNNNFTTQMPEHEAIIPSKTGDFFKDNDANSLCYTIKKWFNTNKSREEVRKNCYEIADSKFNPYNQVSILKRVWKL
jgi:glycosyltransferase involved in cell wall biosynthesis